MPKVILTRSSKALSSLAVAFALMSGCATTQGSAQAGGPSDKIAALEAEQQRLTMRMDELSRGLLDMKERLDRTEALAKKVAARGKKETSGAGDVPEPEEGHGLEIVTLEVEAPVKKNVAKKAKKAVEEPAGTSSVAIEEDDVSAPVELKPPQEDVEEPASADAESSRPAPVMLIENTPGGGAAKLSVIEPAAAPAARGASGTVSEPANKPASGKKPAPPGPAKITPTPPAGKPLPPAVSDEAAALFRKAKSSYDAGRYAVAILDFEQFANTWPNHERADNAWFWIAESYYSQGVYEQAIVEYKRVLERYPRGDVAPLAYLKTGECYEKMDEPEMAREFYNRLVAQYPESEAAREARKRL